eukprot:6456139-Amphidinium_carterae.1
MIYYIDFIVGQAEQCVTAVHQFSRTRGSCINYSQKSCRDLKKESPDTDKILRCHERCAHNSESGENLRKRCMVWTGNTQLQRAAPQPETHLWRQLLVGKGKELRP